MSTNLLEITKQPIRIDSLLDQFTIEHGPAALLGRAILKADQVARKRGVYLSLASCADLVPVNKANAATWKPLAAMFHPSLGGASDNDSLAVIGRNKEGEVVATQAARFFDWCGTNFHDEAETLRLFYARPEQDKMKDERCIATATQAYRITGPTVYSGGGWYRPDFRKKQLSAILPRVSRALTYTRWQQDFTISIMANPVFHGGFAKRAGYTFSEPGVQMIDSPAGLGVVDYYLIWMEARQLLDDLEWFVSDFDAEVDRRIDRGHADQPRRTIVQSKW